MTRCCIRLEGRALQIWDFRTVQQDRILSGHARDVLSCDWHPSSVSPDPHSPCPTSCLAHVSCTTLKNSLCNYAVHTRPARVHGNVQSVVVSSSRDYTIRLWDARLGGEALSSLEGHMNEVTTVQWHRNGHFVLSAGRDNQLKVSAAAPTPAISLMGLSHAAVTCHQATPCSCQRSLPPSSG